MAFLEELNEAFALDLPGVIVHELGRRRRGGRIQGTIEWEGFEGLTMLDRQNRVWDALQARFTAEQLRAVGLISTFTPAEQHALATG